MRFALLVLALVVVSASASAGEGQHHHAKQEVEAPKGPKDYGKGVELKTAPVSLAEGVKAGGDVVIKGKIGTVCQAAGCWFTVNDGKNEARVTFNHAFAIPKKAGQREVLIQGKVSEREISVAEARHYAEDSGMSEAEAKKKITTPQKGFQVESTGVRLL